MTTAPLTNEANRVGSFLRRSHVVGHVVVGGIVAGLWAAVGILSAGTGLVLLGVYGERTISDYVKSSEGSLVRQQRRMLANMRKLQALTGDDEVSIGADTAGGENGPEHVSVHARLLRVMVRSEARRLMAHTKSRVGHPVTLQASVRADGTQSLSLLAPAVTL